MKKDRFFRMRDKVQLVKVEFVDTDMGGSRPVSEVIRDLFCNIREGRERGGGSLNFIMDARQDFEDHTVSVVFRRLSAPELTVPGELPEYLLRETTGQKRSLKPVSVRGGAKSDQYVEVTCKVVTHSEIVDQS